MCIYVYIYVYICINTYIHIYTYTRIYFIYFAGEDGDAANRAAIAEAVAGTTK